jgi:hypothetical protein
MYSKLALALMAAVGSAALVASAQTPNPTVIEVSPHPSPTATVSTTYSGSAPDQDAVLHDEPSSVTVTSTRKTQSIRPGMSGGMAGMARGGSYSVSPGYAVMAGGGQINRMYITEDAGIAHETDQLIRQLGEAKSDSERDKLKAKLGEVLEKQFEQRQKRHEGEIAELEAQVKKLKELVARRQENRREIIARRQEQVLRESQGLGW